MMDTASTLAATVITAGDPSKALMKARFFQAIPGGYAEGDVVVGASVPIVREIAKRAPTNVTPDDMSQLLDHEVHEVRLLAAVLMSDLCKRRSTAPGTRRQIVGLALDKAERLNNWDLVDTVAPHVTGPWLATLPPHEQWAILDPLLESPVVWRRRLAMVSMFGPLRAGDVELPLAVAARLLDDEHDLIHKAVGWLLRDVGLRDRAALDDFLDKNAATMPRTALRYALEKHEPTRKAHYMALHRNPPADWVAKLP